MGRSRSKSRAVASVHDEMHETGERASASLIVGQIRFWRVNEQKRSPKVLQDSVVVLEVVLLDSFERQSDQRCS